MHTKVHVGIHHLHVFTDKTIVCYNQVTLDFSLIKHAIVNLLVELDSHTESALVFELCTSNKLTGCETSELNHPDILPLGDT